MVYPKVETLEDTDDPQLHLRLPAGPGGDHADHLAPIILLVPSRSISCYCIYRTNYYWLPFYFYYFFHNVFSDILCPTNATAKPSNSFLKDSIAQPLAPSRFLNHAY